MSPDGIFLGAAADGTRLVLAPHELSTHAFCLGMTGSGKTGLCTVLLEELLDEGIPVIAVDSKGDLASALLLGDPQVPGALAGFVADPAAQATALGKALGGAGWSLERYQAFTRSFEGRVYTPGSTIGLPLDVLGALQAPSTSEPAALAEAAEGVARVVLGLLGVDADPLANPQALLLVQLLTHLWQNQKPSTLTELIRGVAAPPFATIGALPLDTVVPAKERTALATRLNALLASPKFAAWRQGEPFEIPTLLRAADGRPRLSVYSVAHLGDDDRLFAVAMLLEKLRSWMQREGGAQTLRAVVLIDEIFGYFPPQSNPPTKPPLIALLKQARAFGLGLVLATQNPIDLDYRGLANIGAWWIGRLQTEQDRARIADALAAAASASGASSAELGQRVSTLEKRQFLFHTVHRPAPVVFKSRDAFSALRGPFSAEELTRLAAPMRPAGPAAPAPSAGAPAAAPAAAAPIGLPAELGPLYEVDHGAAVACLVLKFGVRFRVGGAVTEETVSSFAWPLEGTFGAAEALEGQPWSVEGMALVAAQPPGLVLPALPPWVTSISVPKLTAALKERLPSKLDTQLLFDPATKLLSQPMETPEAFTARVLAKQGMSKDAQALSKRLEKKRLDLAQAQSQLTSRKAEKWLSVGMAGLSLLSGRRGLSGVSGALGKQRNESTAADKISDLQLEVTQAEEQLTALREVDPLRYQPHTVLPRTGDLALMRVSVAFIVP